MWICCIYALCMHDIFAIILGLRWKRSALYESAFKCTDFWSWWRKPLKITEENLKKYTYIYFYTIIFSLFFFSGLRQIFNTVVFWELHSTSVHASSPWCQRPTCGTDGKSWDQTNNQSTGHCCYQEGMYLSTGKGQTGPPVAVDREIPQTAVQLPDWYTLHRHASVSHDSCYHWSQWGQTK